MSCGCDQFPNPCACNEKVPYCQPTLPQQEPVSSQLQNLSTNLFGPFQISIQNGRGVWTGLCSLSSLIAGYPRNAGEGFICYILRVLNILITEGTGASFFIPSANGLAAFEALPTIGLYNPSQTRIVPVLGVNAPGQLSFFQLVLGGGGDVIPNDYNPVSNNVSWTQVL